ncbi:MAG TPA: HD-GYP domain-containing protein [Clostridia bacterium]|nr:HD-GYP domain-containing protein [Clostridia bacterium]
MLTYTRPKVLVINDEPDIRRLIIDIQEDSALSNDEMESLGSAMQRRSLELQAAMRKVDSSYSSTLVALVAALDAREHETAAHSFRVRAYTSHMARLAGYPAALLPQLEQAALLHDIGKFAVPDAILLKPDKLTTEEFALLKEHSVVGEQIVSRIDHFRDSAAIIRHHHERYDGSGYPDRLVCDQIPLGSRIFAFADTLDAMTSDRCYRKALTFAEARSEICECAGTQFDPRLTQLFLRIPDSTLMDLRVSAERECPPRTVQ